MRLVTKAVFPVTGTRLLPARFNCIDIRQPAALGLGHAVQCAEPVINDEPFVVILADDLIDASPGATAQLVERLCARPNPAAAALSPDDGMPV